MAPRRSGPHPRHACSGRHKAETLNYRFSRDMCDPRHPAGRTYAPDTANLDVCAPLVSAPRTLERPESATQRSRRWRRAGGRFIPATPEQDRLFQPPSFTSPGRSNGFRDAFPGANDVVSVSRVALSEDGRWAVMMASIECGMLCGRLYGYLLEKVSGAWTFTARDYS